MKKSRTQILMLTLLPVLALTFAGCATQPTTKADAAKAEKAQRIADRLDSHAR